MSKEYIKKHVAEIVSNKEFPFPLNLAMGGVWILGNFKGINLKVIDVKEKSSLTDYLVLCSSTNPIQAKSMASEVVSQLKSHGAKLLSQEGLDDSEWILLDFGDIIVHIFLESIRDVYNFDELWKDAKTVEIPREYYTTSDEEEHSSETTDSVRRNYY